MSETLTRYRQWCLASHGHAMSLEPDGPWVRYRDALAALARAEQAREKMSHDYSLWQTEMRARLAAAEAERDTLRAALAECYPAPKSEPR